MKKLGFKRKYIRFKPDVMAYAELEIEEGRKYRPYASALIFSEAHGGCGLILLADEDLHAGMKVRVKVGRLGPLKGEIAWKKEVDPEIVKIGIQYAE